MFLINDKEKEREVFGSIEKGVIAKRDLKRIVNDEVANKYHEMVIIGRLEVSLKQQCASVTANCCMSIVCFTTLLIVMTIKIFRTKYLLKLVS